MVTVHVGASRDALLSRLAVKIMGTVTFVVTAVHLILNPNRERTVPELYYPELGADRRD